LVGCLFWELNPEKLGSLWLKSSAIGEAGREPFELYTGITRLSMVTEKELAFLKVHLAELSPTVLKLFKWGIVAEKRRREAEAPAKAKGSGTPRRVSAGHAIPRPCL
jgi:hypothetical protein